MSIAIIALGCLALLVGTAIAEEIGIRCDGIVWQQIVMMIVPIYVASIWLAAAMAV